MKTRTEVLNDLKSIVKTDRQKWADVAFERAIHAALTAFADARPLTSPDSLTLEAGKRQYAAPDCLIRYLRHDWFQGASIQPWDAGFPGPTPRIFDVLTAGGRVIEFSPAPTHKHIAAYGAEFVYYYSARHVWTDDDCSIHEDDYDLFVTRALASLMRDLMAANVTEPVQLHRGVGSSVPSIATASVIYDKLMEEYRRGLG